MKKAVIQVQRVFNSFDNRSFGVLVNYEYVMSVYFYSKFSGNSYLTTI